MTLHWTSVFSKSVLVWRAESHANKYTVMLGTLLYIDPCGYRAHYDCGTDEEAKVLANKINNDKIGIGESE